MPLTYRAALFLGAHLVPGMILSNNAAKSVVRIVPSDNVPMMIALAVNSAGACAAATYG